MKEPIIRMPDVLRFEVAPLPDGRWVAQLSPDNPASTASLGSDPLDAIAQVCGYIKSRKEWFDEFMSTVDQTPAKFAE